MLVDQDPTNWHIRYWRMEIYKFIRNSNIIGNRYNVRWDQFLIQGHTQLVEAIPDDKNLPPQVKAYLLAWFQVTKDYQPAEEAPMEERDEEETTIPVFYQPSPITTYELTNGKNPRFFNSRTKKDKLIKNNPIKSNTWSKLYNIPDARWKHYHETTRVIRREEPFKTELLHKFNIGLLTSLHNTRQTCMLCGYHYNHPPGTTSQGKTETVAIHRFFKCPVTKDYGPE